MQIDDLKTGDILLFDERPTSCCFRHFTNCIKSCTKSKYSHCAFVIRNKSLYSGTICVWESSYHPGQTEDPNDHKKNKFGVQVTPLNYYLTKYPGYVNIYVRQRRNTEKNKICKYQLAQIRETVYDKPYDINPCDWLMAKLRCGPRKTTSRFWCSALVAFILVQIGDIPECDWSEIRAQDLSSSCTAPPFEHWNTEFSEDMPLKTRTTI